MPRKKKSSKTEFTNNISIWQKNIPLLYESICQKKLECPSYACTFGNLLNENKDFNKYRLFQSRATNANYLKDKHIWQGLPHALLICNVNIPNKSTNKIYKELTDWSNNNNNNNNNNPNNIHYSEIKRIIHPGPILRIKQMYEFPQIIATHTQHKYVFLWNTSTQHDREMLNNSDPNTPELILKGHKKDAVYALDFSRLSYLVSSGSKDNRICIWNINDYKTTLSSTSEPDKKERFVPLSKPSPKLKPRIILKGHTAEVSDVQFAPNSPNLIGSVSYDKSFKLWDIRQKNKTKNKNKNDTIEIDYSSTSIPNLFKKEITNLSWNTFNTNYILCAAKNGNIKLIDIRNPNKIIKRFNGHKNCISSLEWNPSKVNNNYFLSSSHDGSVIIWDSQSTNTSKDIIFKHIGHMNYYKGNEVIHSASWIKNNNSWCIASTSSPKAFVPFFWSSSSQTQMHLGNENGNQNPNDISEGGIMHIWKPSLLLKKDRNDIIKHLKEKKSKQFVDDINGNGNGKKKHSKNKNKKNENEDIDIQMKDINNNNNNSNMV